jgi:hypothetical protein
LVEESKFTFTLQPNIFHVKRANLRFNRTNFLGQIAAYPEMIKVKNCYLNSFGNCDGKISSEHMFSAGILEYFAGPNGLIEHGGEKWMLGKSFTSKIGKLGSKVLCQRHNNELSPFDTEMLELVKGIENLKAFSEGKGTKFESSIDGGKIERWFAKLILGTVYSNKLDPPDGSAPKLPKELLKLLRFERFSLPSNFGLRISLTDESRSDNQIIQYRLLSDSRNGRVVGVVVSIMGFELQFWIIDVKRINPQYGFRGSLWHPPFIASKHGSSESRVNFIWQLKSRTDGLLLQSLNA